MNMTVYYDYENYTQKQLMLTLKMLDCFEDYQYNIYDMYSHFVSYLGFCSIEEDQIHNGATLNVAYPILSIPFLLMPWLRKSPGH